MEWPKEISKFFSRQKLASISQVGFRVINISSLGVFYKNVGILLGVRVTKWDDGVILCKVYLELNCKKAKVSDHYTKSS